MLGVFPSSAAVFAVAVLLLTPGAAYGWSLAGHRLVSDLAVAAALDACPKLVKGRKRQLAFHAIEPDIILRPRDGKREEIRHFIDLDSYGPPPFSSLPRRYRDALEKWGRETVRGRGVLPWTIGRMARRLEREIEKGDWARARVTAGRLGHYVADSYMPLHLTENHDGQLSGQEGIHQSVEHLVDADAERYADAARKRVRLRPLKIADVEGIAFSDMVESYRLVERILRADREIRRHAKPQTKEYERALDRELGPLVQGQLAKAASMLGGIWVAACAK